MQIRIGITAPIAVEKIYFPIFLSLSKTQKYISRRKKTIPQAINIVCFVKNINPNIIPAKNKLFFLFFTASCWTKSTAK